MTPVAVMCIRNRRWIQK